MCPVVPSTEQLYREGLFELYTILEKLNKCVDLHQFLCVDACRFTVLIMNETVMPRINMDCPPPDFY